MSPKKTLAESFVNLDRCGDAFRNAIAALDGGRDVRRASWPRGKFLRLEKTGLVAIYLDGQLSAPSWDGQEGQFELDWEILEGEQCPACEGTRTFENGTDSGEPCLNCASTGRVVDKMPTTRDEVEAALKAKIESGAAETGLYDTGAWYLVVDRVDGEFTFHWFERAIYLNEVLGG